MTSGGWSLGYYFNVLQLVTLYIACLCILFIHVLGIVSSSEVATQLVALLDFHHSHWSCCCLLCKFLVFGSRLSRSNTSETFWQGGDTEEDQSHGAQI